MSGSSREVAAVSPDEESESDEEEVEVEGTVGEKIKARREDEKIKAMTDPRKPTERG